MSDPRPTAHRSGESRVLLQMGAWLAVNGEAIYGTRPWVLYGEGPTNAPTGREEINRTYTAADLRFTTKGDSLYALGLAWPRDGKVLIKTLYAGTPYLAPVQGVTLLGNSGAAVRWQQTATGLEIQLPAAHDDLPYALKIDASLTGNAMLLEGKTVLITGASRGIGRGTALECARQGADLALNWYRDREGIDETLAEVKALGRRVTEIECDVAERSSAARFIGKAVKELGRVDVFVSNAGICPFHAFLDTPQEMFERTLAVNLGGAYYMTQAAANRMKDQGQGGSIIAISSISALVGGGMQAHYTPTKAAVHSLMQSCAVALGPYGIRCNSVMPGTIATDINKEDLSDPKKRAYMESRIPLGRLGEPRDVAGCVVFLASDLARYVTGAAVLVDGGAFVNLQ